MQVLALDKDSNQNCKISYRLIKGDSHKHFYVDPNSGQISVVKSLDREKVKKGKVNLNLHIECTQSLKWILNMKLNKKSWQFAVIVLVTPLLLITGTVKIDFKKVKRVSKIMGSF